MRSLRCTSALVFLGLAVGVVAFQGSRLQWFVRPGPHCSCVGSNEADEFHGWRLHECLPKDEFLMMDDFHGVVDRHKFMAGRRVVFPDGRVEDASDNDEIVHASYDDHVRLQVPGSYHGQNSRKEGTHTQPESDSRRRAEHHGSHLSQHGSRRCLGMA